MRGAASAAAFAQPAAAAALAPPASPASSGALAPAAPGVFAAADGHVGSHFRAAGKSRLLREINSLTTRLEAAQRSLRNDVELRLVRLDAEKRRLGVALDEAVTEQEAARALHERQLAERLAAAEGMNAQLADTTAQRRILIEHVRKQRAALKESEARRDFARFAHAGLRMELDTQVAARGEAAAAESVAGRDVDNSLLSLVQLRQAQQRATDEADAAFAALPAIEAVVASAEVRVRAGGGLKAGSRIFSMRQPDHDAEGDRAADDVHSRLNATLAVFPRAAAALLDICRTAPSFLHVSSTEDDGVADAGAGVGSGGLTRQALAARAMSLVCSTLVDNARLGAALCDARHRAATAKAAELRGRMHAVYLHMYPLATAPRRAWQPLLAAAPAPATDAGHR